MTRDPRTYVVTRPGAIGHPGFGRDDELFVRLMSELKACVVAEATELGLKVNDLMNNILVERYHGKLVEPTQEQLAQEKTLTPAEAVAHLDPTLKGGFDRDQLITHFEGLAAQEPLTLDVLEAEEDKQAEALYREQLDLAEQRATPTKGDPMGPRIKGDVNHKRYAEEIELAKQKKQREDRARAKRRELRRKLLTVATLMVAPTLRQEGDPRLHRQYEQPSSWATMGGYTKRDRAAALKDSS